MIPFVALLAGYALVVVGAAWISPPLGLVVGGAGIMLGAWWWEKGAET